MGIRLNIAGGRLEVGFSLGPAVPAGGFRCVDCGPCCIDEDGCCVLCGADATQEPTGAPDPALPLPDGHQHQKCACELRSEPGEHPICDVFERSIMHESFCVTCWHAEKCHAKT